VTGGGARGGTLWYQYSETPRTAVRAPAVLAGGAWDECRYLKVGGAQHGNNIDR